ncbi:MAG: tetratricopeptide repeat protein [Deltaproteobacteria bacterium]|nr:tetratricopeptide repeat protein [Deltaproteobacteria bacterium]
MRTIFLFFLIFVVTFVVHAQSFKEQIKYHRDALTRSPGHPEHLFKLAQFLGWDGQYDEAIKIYQKIIADDPKHTDAYLGLAHAYAWKQMFKKSIETCEKILKYEPQNISALLNIAQAYYWGEDFDKAKEYYNRVLKIDSENYQAQQGLAKMLDVKVASIYVRESLEKLLKELETKPDDKDLRVALAQKLIAKREYDKALIHVKKAYNMDPEDLDVVLLLAQVYSWDGQYKMALQGYDQVLAKNPKHYEALMGKGRAYAWAGFYKKAIEHLNEVVKIYPKSDEAFLMLGRVYAWDKQYPNSVQTYKEILKREPTNLDAQMGLAEAYQWSGELGKSISIHLEVLKRSPKNIDSMMKLGAMYSQRGEIDKAIYWYNQAAEIEPQRAEIHAGLGVLYSYSARVDDAATALKKSIELDDTNILNYVALGRVYGWQRNIDEAKSLFKRALKMAPDNIDILNGYARVLYYNGEWTESEKLYHQSLKIQPKNFEAVHDLENLEKAKAPTLQTRYNSFKEDLFDASPATRAVTRVDTSERGSLLFTYKWTPQLDFSGRYQYSNFKRERPSDHSTRHHYSQNTVSLGGQVPFSDYTYFRGRLDWNEFKNEDSSAAFILEVKQMFTGFGIFRWTQENFDMNLSVLRQEDPESVSGTSSFVIRPLDVFGGSLGYGVSDYSEVIGSYFYNDYHPATAVDKDELSGAFFYKLPFWAQMKLGYEYYTINHPTEKRHRMSANFKDRWLEKLLVDLKLQFERSDDHGNFGVTYAYELRGVLAYELFSNFYLTTDFKYERELGVDKDKSWNGNIYFEYILF